MDAVERLLAEPATLVRPAKGVVMASDTLTYQVPTSFWRRLLHGGRRTWQRDDWPALVGADWASTIMQTDVTDDFHAKQGRSTGRWLIEKNGQTLGVYLKRHYRLPWWSGLLAACCPWGQWSPAVQELRNLQWARAQGLLGSRTRGGRRVHRALGQIAEHSGRRRVDRHARSAPGHPAGQPATGPGTFRIWKKGLAQEMARLAQELHRRRFFHKDLYLCHFYIARADTSPAHSVAGQSVHDRFPSPGPASTHLAHLAGQGPGPAPVLILRRRRRRPGPVVVLALLPGQRHEPKPAGPGGALEDRFVSKAQCQAKIENANVETHK